MKKKLSHIIVLALVAVAVLIVLVVAVARLFDADITDPLAGHDHSTTAGLTTSTNNNTPSESYTLTENQDGTYTYKVQNRMGGIMYSRENVTEKPTFTQMTDLVLEIAGQTSKDNNLTGWAVYCNIQTMDVSRRFDRVLASADSRVVYLDYRSGKWVVFVSDQFNEDTYLEGTELTGLTISESGSPKIDYEVTESGDLEVTYDTADGKKTVTVKLAE